MLEIQPPQALVTTSQKKIFLAGSIEMGLAEPWQDHVMRELEHTSVVIYNPRRDDWDASWKQSKSDPRFKEQVVWELDALAQSDLIILYFDVHTKSPISLLELGLYADSGKLLVVCADGFWRKGNVDIVCEQYGIPQFENLEEVIDHVRTMVK